MIVDYHVHTFYSPDSNAKMQDYIEAALAKNINEICFTDHTDIDVQSGISVTKSDYYGVKNDIDALDKKGITVKFGAEIGLSSNDDCIKQNDEIIAQHDFDFIIASVHLVDGLDPYLPAYFSARNEKHIYSDYIDAIYKGVLKSDNYSTVGHYDFPLKYNPTGLKEINFKYIKDSLEPLFKHVIQKGKCIEINTSTFRKIGHPIGQDVINFYAQLGGEYITIGSDSHYSETLGSYFAEACAMAKNAGIKYFATFEKMSPIMHKI